MIGDSTMPSDEQEIEVGQCEKCGEDVVASQDYVYLMSSLTPVHVGCENAE